MSRSGLFRIAAVGGAAVVVAGALLTGSSTAAPAPAPAPTASAPYTAFTVTGAAGNPVLDGRTLSYPVGSVSSSGDRTYQSISVVTAGSPVWTIALTAPGGQQLAPGQYRNADRNGSGRLPGLDVRTSLTSCQQPVYGRFDIEQIAFGSDDLVSMIEVSFQHRCGSATAPPLTGTLWYRATPLSFSYTAEAGEPVTGGGRGTYTGATSEFRTTEYLGSQEFTVDGPRSGWLIGLTPPTGQQLQVGTYQISAYGDATKAGLLVSFNREGRTGNCPTPTGTLTIREVAYAGAVISALDASFVHRCGSDPARLRGTIQFHAGTFPALPPST